MFDNSTTNTERTEGLKALCHLAAVLVALATVPGLLRRGWWSGADPHLTKTLLSLPTVVGAPEVAIQGVLAGLLLGGLTALSFDVMKRLQAGLLWVLTAFVTVFLLVSGFKPLLFRAPLVPALGSVLVGWLAGVAVSATSVNLRALTERNQELDLEFRRAAHLAVGLIGAAVVLMAFEASVAYTRLSLFGTEPAPTGPLMRGDQVPRAVLGVVSTGWICHQLVTYDHKSEVLVLGPKGAGKTYFTVAAYLEEVDRPSVTVSAPSQALSELTNTLQIRARDRADRWHLENTDAGERSELQFTRRTGQWFPRNTTLRSMDYAGENLRGLATLLNDDTLTAGDLSTEDLPPGANPEDVAAMHEWAADSETLILLLDGELLRDAGSLPDTRGASTAEVPASGGLVEPTAADGGVTAREGVTGDPEAARKLAEHLGAYASIIDAYGDQRQVLFAVTKADIVDEAFQRDYELDLYDRGDIEAVADRLSHELTRDPVVSEVLRDAGVSGVYPVYFRTKRTESGERVPVRPTDGGGLIPYGYHRLMEDVR